MRSLSTGHSLFNQNSKTDENKTQCSNASHIKTQAEDSSDYTTNESDIEEKFLSTASLLIIYINQVLDTFKETSVYKYCHGILNIKEYDREKAVWNKACKLKMNENRPVEMKNILGGATNYKILSATMVGRRGKFFISNHLKGLKKLNICRR